MKYYVYRRPLSYAGAWASDRADLAGNFPGCHPGSGRVDLVGEVDVVTDLQRPPMEGYAIQHAASLAWNLGQSRVEVGPLVDQPVLWPEIHRFCRSQGFDERFFFVYFSGRRPGYFAGFVPPVSIGYQALAQMVCTKRVIT